MGRPAVLFVTDGGRRVPARQASIRRGWHPNLVSARLRRGWDEGRALETPPLAKHSTKGDRRRVPADMRRRAIRRVADGVPVAVVARCYGVHRRTVYRWLRGAQAGRELAG